jgi:hypothetical protein
VCVCICVFESTRRRIGRFVRGVAIHEFIRDRICTWQPELLVIKMRRSPFAPSSPTSFSREKREREREREARIRDFLTVVVSSIMYAGETIRVKAALLCFIVVSAETRSQTCLTFCPARPFIPLYGDFLFARLLRPTG